MDDGNDQSIDITEPEEPMDDKVFIDITKMLYRVKLESEKPSDPRIGRVPKHLRDVNAKAYKPQIIAIGPYHRRCEPHLQVMENHKLLYLKMLLKRKGEDDLKRYVKTMRELEERAHACYIEAVYLNGNRFVKMLLLDACFIVELFRNFCRKRSSKFYRKRFVEDIETKYYDPIFDSSWMQVTLCRDLLLVENQIPFFVLNAFFHMTATENEQNYFLKIISFFFHSLLHNHFYDEEASNDLKIAEIEHLLSFVHDHWFRLVVKKSPISGTRKWKIFKIFSLLRKGHDSNEVEIDNWAQIRCATELKEAGIKFRVAEKRALFDVEFEDGTMKIPKLTIEDNTESFFRNLIFYEQLCANESNPVVDYVCFMDCLINSTKDVELLCQRKVVDNFLGDEEVVAKMFNRLSDSVTLSSPSHYSKISGKVNRYCEKRRNKWMANLKHNYFNTPWALISFLAAVLLILLAFTQTLFSVLAYWK